MQPMWTTMASNLAPSLLPAGGLCSPTEVPVLRLGYEVRTLCNTQGIVLDHMAAFFYIDSLGDTDSLGTFRLNNQFYQPLAVITLKNDHFTPFIKVGAPGSSSR